MNVQDLGAIGEFISSIAIVITLIFLTMETRQARNATQQSNRQARHRIRTDLNLALAENPSLCEVLARSTQHLNAGKPLFDSESEWGLSAHEGMQFFSYSLAFLWHFEDQYFSDLPETDRSSLESQIRILLGIPPFLKHWEVNKSGFDKRFQEYADDLIREGAQGDAQS